MARTQAHDYEEKRLAIEDAAAALFAEHGFHGTAISDIAKACGMSKPSLYHYFASKEDILQAVMEDHIALLLSISDDIKADATSDPRKKLRLLCKRFMGAYVNAANRHVVLLNDLGALPPELAQTIKTRQNAIIDNILEIIAETRPEVLRNPAFRKPVTMIFMGMINWTHTWFDADGPVSTDAFADLATDIFLNGITPQTD